MLRSLQYGSVLKCASYEARVDQPLSCREDRAHEDVHVRELSRGKILRRRTCEWESIRRSKKPYSRELESGLLPQRVTRHGLSLGSRCR